MELPKLEDILTLVRKCRADRLSVNPGVLSHRPDQYRTAYGAPQLNVVSSDWLHVWDRPWDYTLESIREAAEIADEWDGWVELAYPIIIADPSCDYTGKEIDEGFEIQVYPKLALRMHNEFVTIQEDEDE